MLTLVAAVLAYDLACDGAEGREIVDLSSVFFGSRKAMSWTRLENDILTGSEQYWEYDRVTCLPRVWVVQEREDRSNGRS